MMGSVLHFVSVSIVIAVVTSSASSFTVQSIVPVQGKLDLRQSASRLRETVQRAVIKLGRGKLSQLVGMEQKTEKPWFCHGLGCPGYKELNKTKDYEVREYAASRWVTTSLQNVSYDGAVSKMFGRLFNYIEGENVKKEKVAMTAPVIVKTIAGQGPACKSTFILSFFIDPSAKDVPDPSKSDIYFSSLAKQKVFVGSFGGRANENKWVEAADTLAAALQRDGKKFASDYFYTAGYDSPFRLLDRHNEVWFISQE